MWFDWLTMIKKSLWSSVQTQPSFKCLERTNLLEGNLRPDQGQDPNQLSLLLHHLRRLHGLRLRQLAERNNYPDQFWAGSRKKGKKPTTSKTRKTSRFKI